MTYHDTHSNALGDSENGAYGGDALRKGPELGDADVGEEFGVEDGGQGAGGVEVLDLVLGKESVKALR